MSLPSLKVEFLERSERTEKVETEVGEPLVVRVMTSGRRFKIWVPIHFKGVCEDGTVFDFIVPVGFETDFASIPRGLWNILPPQGKHSRAAVAHDYLYYTGMFPRNISDKIFLIIMVALDVSRWRQRVMFRGVRVGAMFAWRKHRERRIEEALGNG